jgi:sigma-B regulation protein RsbU (phosphoserine phosphatase)
VELEAETADRLRRLEAVSDPDLSEFRSKDLLPELLDRVKDVMAVDTVAVLVVDRGGSHLVARITRGLDEEVRQGFRIRIGHGFAGRVAATRSPVAIEEVGPGTVVNPLLWRKGIRSILGVPLLVDGRLVGVMHVGALRPRIFSDEDTNVLQVAANRIAATLVSEQLTVERAAARVLQESLLPSDLPDVAGLEFATRFVAAVEFGVGGDWYDAFVLPDGRIGIVIGDVAGNGLAAAVVMGRLRSSLRAYAIESARPGETLDRLRRDFTHFEPTEMATVMYMTIAPDLDEFVVASTGHLPPVLLEPGRDAVLLDCSPSPPLGVDDPTPHVDTTRALVPGTTVVMYTDGLIERRTAPIDEGLERLRSSCRAGSADEICGAIVDELVGEQGVEDDTALLVFRRAPSDDAAT